MIIYWDDGSWNLIAFTLQMAMILIGGYSMASSSVVDNVLSKLSTRITSTNQAIVITTILSLFFCWINWGFGLVIGAMFCRKIYDVMPYVNFRLLVASSYSGFIIWHGGISGNIPLLLATSGDFLRN